MKQYKYEFVFKVTVLGEPAVGKTSLIQRFTQGTFVTNYIATIGAQFSRYEMIEDEVYTRLFFWDVAGQREFTFMRPTFYTGSKAAILVFDLSEPSTFDALQSWVDDLFQHTGEIPITVFANKCDLEHAFEEERLKRWVEEKGFLGYFYTSAKTGDNVETAFKAIISKLLEMWKSRPK
ncbi:MAG: Rab family GTPase [Promethearchaeota archaeon]